MTAGLRRRPPGRTTAYIIRPGDDDFGRLLLDLWRVQRVDASAVGNDPHAPTGPYFAGHGIAGHRFSYLRAGSAASRMQPADVPAALIAGAECLHVSGISQALSASAIDAVLHAIELARRAGVRVAYERNLRLILWPLARALAILSATTALVDHSWPASTT